MEKQSSVQPLSDKEKSDLISSIKVQYEGSNISVGTIFQITNAAIKFVLKDLADVIYQARTKRKSVLNSIPDYVSEVKKYNAGVISALDKGEEEVLKALKISKKVFEQSNAFYMAQNDQQLMILQMTLPSRITSNLPSSKALTQDEFLKVIKGQLEFLNKELESIPKFADLVTDMDEVSMIIQSRAADYLADKFGVFEEDLIGNMRKYINIPEVNQTLMQINQFGNKVANYFSRIREGKVAEMQSEIKSIKDVQIEKSGSYLSPKTIIQINEAIILASKDAFAKYYKEHTEMRRGVINNIQKYFEVWSQFEVGLESLIIVKGEEVLKQLGLSVDLWDESFTEHVDRKQNRDVYMSQMKIPSRLRNSLPVNKKLSAEELKAVLEYQCQIVEEEKKLVEPIMKKFRHPNMVINLVDSRMSDRIYIKFGVAEQDLIASMQEHGTNPELQKLAQKAMNALVKGFHQHGPGCNHDHDDDHDHGHDHHEHGPDCKHDHDHGHDHHEHGPDCKHDHEPKKEVKIPENQPPLSAGVIVQLSNEIVKKVAPKYVELVKHDRETRRANFDNLEEYVMIGEDYAKDLEDLMTNGKKEVLQEKGLSEAYWEKSTSHHISQGNQEVMMMQFTILQRLKYSLLPSKTITADEFKTILKAQLKHLKEEKNNLEKLKALVINPEDAISVILNRVNDTLNKEFGVEEEVLNQAIENYKTDQEISKLLEEYQKAYMDISVY